MAMTGYPGDGTPYQAPAMQPTQFGNDLLMPGTRIRREDGSIVVKQADGSWQPELKNENGDSYYSNKNDWENPEEAPEWVQKGKTQDETSALSANFTLGNNAPKQPDTASKQKSYSPRPWWMMHNPFGREPSANYKEDFANNYDKSAANQQMVAQRYWQEANKDFRNEQAKNDQTQANTRFTESQQQMNGSDNTSLVGRQLISNDPTQREQWQLQQLANAKQAQEAEINDRNSAVQWRKTGAEDQYRYRQNALYNLGSTQLSLGPGQEKEKEKTEKDNTPPQPSMQDNNNGQSENAMLAKASHQDVLNCIMKKHGKEITAEYPDVPDVTGGRDWKEVSRSDPGSSGLEHTLFKQPELDTPEYHQAVEELADKLWNGEQITVGGKTFGGNGVSGPAAAYALWTGRGGSKGWEEAQDKSKWNAATKGSMEQQNNIAGALNTASQYDGSGTPSRNSTAVNSQWMMNRFGANPEGK